MPAAGYKLLNNSIAFFTLNHIIFIRMEENNASQLPRYRAPEAKVLVIDDMPTNIRLIKELLAPCEVKLYIALSGAKAIAMVEKEYYDLIFMDHMMPEMDGLETSSRIRALKSENSDLSRYYRTVPIILLTANLEPGTDESLSQYGINGCITKPIDLEKLYGTIERMLPPDKIIPC